MSGSDPGLSDSISRISPTAIALIASRVFTTGIGQNNPVQSIFLSGLKTFDSRVMKSEGTPRSERPSRRPPDGPAPSARGERAAKYSFRRRTTWLCWLHAFLDGDERRIAPRPRPGLRHRFFRARPRGPRLHSGAVG